MKDKIVDQVVEKYQTRSAVGIRKYNSTLENNNSDDGEPKKPKRAS